MILNKAITSEFLVALSGEMDSAEREHGALTTDEFKAFTVLGEEVGEVACAILEWKRSCRIGQPCGQKRQELIRELLQVASVSCFMVFNLLGVDDNLTQTVSNQQPYEKDLLHV